MKTYKTILLLALVMLTMAATPASAGKKETFAIGDKTFLLNGKPFVVKAAEVHYPRIPQA